MAYALMFSLQMRNAVGFFQELVLEEKSSGLFHFFSFLALPQLTLGSVCAVLWRVFSTAGYHQYCGGIPFYTVENFQYC